MTMILMIHAVTLYSQLESIEWIDKKMRCSRNPKLLVESCRFYVGSTCS